MLPRFSTAVSLNNSKRAAITAALLIVALAKIKDTRKTNVLYILYTGAENGT